MTAEGLLVLARALRQQSDVAVRAHIHHPGSPSPVHVRQLAAFLAARRPERAGFAGHVRGPPGDGSWSSRITSTSVPASARPMPSGITASPFAAASPDSTLDPWTPASRATGPSGPEVSTTTRRKPRRLGSTDAPGDPPRRMMARPRGPAPTAGAGTGARTAERHEAATGCLQPDRTPCAVRAAAREGERLAGWMATRPRPPDPPRRAPGGPRHARPQRRRRHHDHLGRRDTRGEPRRMTCLSWRRCQR